jgi:cysteine-rich repeat protein
VIGHFRRLCGDGAVDAGESCDDGNGRDGDGCSAVCTVEPCFACAGAPSACVPVDGAACDDGNPCTGDGSCEGGHCVPGVAVSDGAACDDGDACTSGDRCVSGTCRGSEPLACEACTTCDRRFGCVGVVRDDCHASPRVGSWGALVVNAGPDATPSVRWRWASPAPSAIPDLGRAGLLPDSRYTLCVYGRGERPTYFGRRRTVLGALGISGGGSCGGRSCWGPRRSGVGSPYRDPAGTSDGVTRFVFRRGRGRTPSLLLDARGPRVLVTPPPYGNVTPQLDAPPAPAGAPTMARMSLTTSPAVTSREAV